MNSVQLPKELYKPVIPVKLFSHNHNGLHVFKNKLENFYPDILFSVLMRQESSYIASKLGFLKLLLLVDAGLIKSITRGSYIWSLHQTVWNIGGFLSGDMQAAAMFAFYSTVYFNEMTPLTATQSRFWESVQQTKHETSYILYSLMGCVNYDKHPKFHTWFHPLPPKVMDYSLRAIDIALFLNCTNKRNSIRVQYQPIIWPVYL